MNIPDLKKGDKILIKDGQNNCRDLNPRGEIVVTFIRLHGGDTFLAASTGLGDYWYGYNEIIKVLPATPRKGKLIGGYSIQ